VGYVDPWAKKFSARALARIGRTHPVTPPLDFLSETPFSGKQDQHSMISENRKENSDWGICQIAAASLGRDDAADSAAPTLAADDRRRTQRLTILLRGANSGEVGSAPTA
jgi:hypothetical protein